MADNPVETHYTSADLGKTILAALKEAGKDVDHLTPDDLAPVDEFHGGQRPATVRLAELVGFTGTERVLDVGSGLGGPSRYLAWHYGCRVSGVDLTAEFVRVAVRRQRLRRGLVTERGDEHCRPRPPLPRDAAGAETRRPARPAGGRRRARRAPALSGAMGARAEHQLSAVAKGDPREARSSRFPRRRLAGYDRGVAAGGASSRRLGG